VFSSHSEFARCDGIENTAVDVKGLTAFMLLQSETEKQVGL